MLFGKMRRRAANTNLDFFLRLLFWLLLLSRITNFYLGIFPLGTLTIKIYVIGFVRDSVCTRGIRAPAC